MFIVFCMLFKVSCWFSFNIMHFIFFTIKDVSMKAKTKLVLLHLTSAGFVARLQDVQQSLSPMPRLQSGAHLVVF